MLLLYVRRIFEDSEVQNRRGFGHSRGAGNLKIFSNTLFARRAGITALSRLGSCWRNRVRATALGLVCVLLANSLGEGAAPRPKPAATDFNGRGSAVAAAMVGTVALIGVGTYFIIQQAHTVKGCVSDDPDHLLLHTDDGKTYVLLGATTHINADTRIKVRGTRKKKIKGLTDQPTFIVEKVNKVYGACSVNPTNP
jgi:hypothetical protein